MRMLRASDISNRTFDRRFVGADRGFVSRLVDELAAAVGSAEAERDRLRERHAGLAREAEASVALDRQLREVMVQAQREVEAMELSARSESAVIVERARMAALDREEALEAEHSSVAADLAAVKEIERQLRTETRLVVAAALRALEQADSAQELFTADAPAVTTDAVAGPVLEAAVSADSGAVSGRVEDDDTLSFTPLAAEVVDDVAVLPAEVDRKPARRSLVLSAAILLAGALVAIGIWQLASTTSDASATPPRSAAGVVTASREPELASTTDPIASSTTAERPVSGVTTQGSGAGGTGVVALRLSARGGDCWLQVRRGSSRGPVLFEGFLNDTSTKSFKGSRLWVRMGNGGHLEGALNGVTVALPPGTADVVVTGNGVRRV